jgi:DNA-directed RNA polymerase specialized sigma24 family protein
MPASNDRAWSLTRESLNRLLGLLGDDAEAAAVEYETIHRKLVAFFQLRGLPGAETLADEVLNRVARKLEAGEQIERPRSYCYAVAQYVALESGRQQAREQAALAELRGLSVDGQDSSSQAEARMECLERCIKKLPADDRRLILGYFREGGTAKGRQQLAKRLGLTYPTLRSRASRIRCGVVACLAGCLEQAKARHK